MTLLVPLAKPGRTTRATPHLNMAYVQKRVAPKGGTYYQINAPIDLMYFTMFFLVNSPKAEVEVKLSSII